MALSALCTVSEDTNQTGRTSLFDLPVSNRYRRISAQTLASDSLIYAISSSVMQSVSNDCAFVMISSPFFNDYNGRFVQLSAREGMRTTIDNLATQGFDDLTTGMLMIGTNRGAETRLSFRDIFLDKWNDVIDEALAGTPATANGDPLLTWEMFPGPTAVGLNAELTYLHAFQALKVEIRIGPGVTYHYDAGIGFYIFLFVDARNRINAFVAGSEVWVSPGFYHDNIEEVLREKVTNFGIPTLNSQLAAQLAAFAGIRFQDVYYLPGDQRRTVPDIFTGSTWTDVTIVLEHAP